MLIRTKNFELEINTRSLFIKAFNSECFIHQSDTSAWVYFKDSPTEREVQLGRVKVMLSKTIH